jgi:conjugal transfer mating pair stabilization protein TraN
MVGTYCAQSFLGYCLQTDQTWCCFPSLLANIIQQQTRAAQGLPISGWGTPMSPNCIGYTPQQFQAINFSQINLSAFYNSIEQQTSSVISNAATNAVNKFQQSISGN